MFQPAFLPIGTEVSAKYRGAFCEAKVKKAVKLVKLKVSNFVLIQLWGGFVCVHHAHIVFVYVWKSGLETRGGGGGGSKLYEGRGWWLGEKMGVPGLRKRVTWFMWFNHAELHSAVCPIVSLSVTRLCWCSRWYCCMIRVFRWTSRNRAAGLFVYICLFIYVFIFYCNDCFCCRRDWIFHAVMQDCSCLFSSRWQWRSLFHLCFLTSLMSMW